MKKLLILTSLLFVPALLIGQSGLDPADMLKPLKDQWTSYSGDLTGKRYSALKLINTNTVKNLSLKWVASNITTGCGPTGTAPAAAGRLRRWRRPRRRRRRRRRLSSAAWEPAKPTIAAPRGWAAAFCSWTASSTPRRPTTSGPSMRAMARCSGTTTGRPAAAPACRPAAWACGTTTSTSNCMTIGWSAWTQEPARKSGRRRSPASTSSTSLPTPPWSWAIT